MDTNRDGQITEADEKDKEKGKTATLVEKDSGSKVNLAVGDGVTCHAVCFTPGVA